MEGLWTFFEKQNFPFPKKLFCELEEILAGGEKVEEGNAAILGCKSRREEK